MSKWREGCALSVRLPVKNDNHTSRAIRRRRCGAHDKRGGLRPSNGGRYRRLATYSMSGCGISCRGGRRQDCGTHFFSPVVVSTGTKVTRGMGLAPMAVMPERQGQGHRISAGPEGDRCPARAQNCPFIIVLGHPKFYPRFGFVPASRHGIRCQWEGVPDDAFIVLVLDKGAMGGISGTANYMEEFDK